MTTKTPKPRTRRTAHKARTARDDAWESDTLGFGTEAYDKTRSFTFRRIQPMTAQAAMDMFHGDDLARRICSKLPGDAMKQGFGLQFPDDEKGELAQGILSELSDLGTDELLPRTRSFANACGGAGCYVGALDGGEPKEPLDLPLVRDVLFLNEYDRRELEISATYGRRMEKNYGKPARYRLMPPLIFRGSRQNAEKETREERELMPVVHESRMLMFGGVATARTERQLNQGWDFSVLDSIQSVLRQCNTTWHSIGLMTLEASQAVWKIAGLKGMIDAGNTAAVTRRMRLIERGRSVTRAVIIGDNEEFTRIAAQFTGIDKVAETTWQRLATAADMPLTVLMGVSPAGMNATGESDMKLWYDRVAAERRLVFEPVIVKLVTMLLAKRGMADMTGWTVIWPSLWLETPKEQADRRLTVAQTDAIEVSKLGVLPEEIAISRHRDDGWNAETQIDVDARAKIKAAKLKRMIENASNPPEAVAAAKAEQDKATASAKAQADADAAAQAKAAADAEDRDFVAKLLGPGTAAA